MAIHRRTVKMPEPCPKGCKASWREVNSYSTNDAPYRYAIRTDVQACQGVSPGETWRCSNCGTWWRAERQRSWNYARWFRATAQQQARYDLKAARKDPQYKSPLKRIWQTIS